MASSAPATAPSVKPAGPQIIAASNEHGSDNAGVSAGEGGGSEPAAIRARGWDARYQSLVTALETLPRDGNSRDSLGVVAAEIPILQQLQSVCQVGEGTGYWLRPPANKVWLVCLTLSAIIAMWFVTETRTFAKPPLPSLTSLCLSSTYQRAHPQCSCPTAMVYTLRLVFRSSCKLPCPSSSPALHELNNLCLCLALAV